MDDGIDIGKRVFKGGWLEAITFKVAHVAQGGSPRLSLASGASSAHADALDLRVLECDVFEQVVADVAT
eukprot:CAMPEP_0185571422 /NCGR_PEP_ID=MMETSP0434-20130131/3471_1 /TAXON_ID=626734 ORGANISM="Favella taraikaensis, Strain Fe Narragansett Bay" /NCGR_SAMPLE_ID=MMETSP0434 /ASSEMBLY_ACC=CAM_ASM_000379 /LENGTH=68 /DNA_ID=CAMNT_0028186847 /DNA_START=514 /DNA_END=720 /DNA_ORIENTATION=-